MKIKRLGLLALIICLALVALSGCAGGTDTPTTPEMTAAPTTTAPTTTAPTTTAPTTTTPTTETPAPPAFKLDPSLDLSDTFTLASANADPIALSEAIAEMLTKYTPMTVNVARSSATGDALTRIADTAGVLAINNEGCVPCHRVALWSTAQNYYDGTIFTIGGTVGILQPDRGNLRALFSNTPDDTVMWGMAGIITLADSGIETVADLKGKKVYAQNTNVRFIKPIMQAILAANGMTDDDIEWLTFSGGADVTGLPQSEGDAILYIFGDDLLELAQGNAVHIIPLDEATQKAVEEIDYGYQAAMLPDGMVPGVPETPVLGTPRVAWVSADTSDDVAYAFTKTVLENLDELHQAEELSINFTVENALSQWRFPYHPGAIRYYKEIGVWTSEMDQRQAALLAKWAS